jgi:hypothetical protein
MKMVQTKNMVVEPGLVTGRVDPRLGSLGEMPAPER